MAVVDLPFHRVSPSQPTSHQFLLCTVGIFFLFVINGLASERLFQIPGFQPFGGFLTLVQFIFYTVLSWTEIKMRRRKPKKKVPFSTFATVAFFAVVTTGLSNASVGYLNYPTQLIFKSCKIIPVMIGGIFIQGKRYGIIEFCAAFLMTVGLVFFSLADTMVTPNFQVKGLIMVALALAADAFIGNFQEKVMKKYSITNSVLIWRTYSIGVLFLLVSLLISGELLDAVQFCNQNAAETYPLMVLFAVTAFFGVNLILVLIRLFGAVAAVTITTFRKAVTIMLSFLLFAKPFTLQYVWAGSLVFFAIYLQVIARHVKFPNCSGLLSMIQLCLRQLQIWTVKPESRHPVLMSV